MSMVVTNVVFENGQFFKLVTDTVPEPFCEQILTSVDRDGTPTYVEVKGFRAKEETRKHSATFFQWMIWKLFKVYP